MGQEIFFSDFLLRFGTGYCCFLANFRRYVSMRKHCCATGH